MLGSIVALRSCSQQRKSWPIGDSVLPTLAIPRIHVHPSLFLRRLQYRIKHLLYF